MNLLVVILLVVLLCGGGGVWAYRGGVGPGFNIGGNPVALILLVLLILLLVGGLRGHIW